MFSGAFTALVTPFRNGEVDVEALEGMVEFQIQGGVNGLVPCGTTGETPAMSEEELGKVSVVGTGMLNRPGYAARMFATLGEAGIPIRLVSTSEIQVTCVLPAGRVEEAVRVLHRDFELEERDV